MAMSAFYGRSDDNQSALTIRTALDCGIRMFDTADMYGMGHNEELVGISLKNCRHDVVIATKAGIYRENGKSLSNGSKDHIISSCNGSLNRLRTDYIDLYQYHRPDRNVPITESLEAFHTLVLTGKVRYIGVCNFSYDQLKLAAESFPIVSVQNEYSLLSKMENESILTYCESRGISFIAYSPLAKGLLAGKKAESLGVDDYRASHPWFKDATYEENRKKFILLQELADLKGTSPSCLALAWIIHSSPQLLPIVGARTPEQIKSNADVLSIRLTTEEFSMIDQLFQ
jgi:aryl-alcohol dehydrogenase-like predicted oxidoreductase